MTSAGYGLATSTTRAGAASTSRVDSTMPNAARWATKPTAAAPEGHAGASAAAAMPASWVTVIRGIAAKFNRRPARLMRENHVAAIGSSATSAQTVAPRSRSAALAAGPPRGPSLSTAVDAADPASRGIPARMPSVAPNVSWKPASASCSGEAATRQAPASASVLSGRVRRSAARASRNVTAVNVARATDGSGPTTSA